MTLDEVKNRLISFGCTIGENDEVILGFEIEKVTNTIKNDCNLAEIPEGLKQIAIDMVCGHFLELLKTMKPDEIESIIDFDSSVVKQIQTGDTNTVFEVNGTKSTEQRFDSFCDYLINYGRDEFSCYRRLRW